MRLPGKKQVLVVILALASCVVWTSSCGEGQPKNVHLTQRSPASNTQTSGTSKAPNSYRSDASHDDPRRDGDNDDSGNDVDGDGDGIKTDLDGDDDGAGHRRFDHDDLPLLRIGQPAQGGEKRAIANLIRRYYTAAAEGKGAVSCALTDSVVIHAIPQDEGTPGYGPSYLRGLTTCSAIRSRFFKYTHAELTAPVQIVTIRVYGRQANVLLRSATMPLSVMQVRRTANAWKIDRFAAGSVS